MIIINKALIFLRGVAQENNLTKVEEFNAIQVTNPPPSTPPQEFTELNKAEITKRNQITDDLKALEAASKYILSPMVA